MNKDENWKHTTKSHDSYKADDMIFDVDTSTSRDEPDFGKKVKETDGVMF